MPPTLTLPPTLRYGNRVAQLVPRWLPLFLKGGREKYVSEAPRKELNVLTSYRLNDFKKKVAFTLAEVLITLAIIGVVAAMTIPTLIADYRAKALESGFKKSYSLLMQSLINVQNEYWGGFGPGDSTYQTEFYKALWKSYKIETHNSIDEASDLLEYRHNRKYIVKDYAGNIMETFPGCPQLPTHILADGSAVGGIYNCYANWLMFDVNGAGGPNALGHDIFYFGFDSTVR